MRIGIYVGSFNPPHEGHKHVADYILDHKIVDKVLLLPTPNYWYKKDLVDIKDRVKMLKFYEDENIQVDAVHNNFPYTYEVLRSLKKDYKDDELYLVIGSDNLEKFHEWKNIEEIIKNKVIVLKRKIINKNKYLNDTNFIYENDFDFLDISSTEIRNGNYKYIDPRIEKYIKENNLYCYK